MPRLTPTATTPPALIKANATRWRHCATKHEALAAEYRNRADEFDALYREQLAASGRSDDDVEVPA